MYNSHAKSKSDLLLVGVVDCKKYCQKIAKRTCSLAPSHYHFAKRTCSLAPSHYHFAKIILFDFFMIRFSLTVFRRFHEKWRETTLKNSEIFRHRIKSHLLSFMGILPKECCRPLPRCQKISMFLIVFSLHFP